MDGPLTLFHSTDIWNRLLFLMKSAAFLRKFAETNKKLFVCDLHFASGYFHLHAHYVACVQ